MATRNLTNWSDPLFRKKSRLVEKYDERLWTLLDDMRETLEKAGGYGCAAVHVGVLRRVVVIHGKSGTLELINPIIIEASEQMQTVKEGSIAPDSPHGEVIRPKSVTVSAFDRHGNEFLSKCEGFLAAVFCHEIGHLDGILFTDKAVKP